METFNEVWGIVGGGLEEGKFLNIAFKNIIVILFKLTS